MKERGDLRYFLCLLIVAFVFFVLFLPNFVYAETIATSFPKFSVSGITNNDWTFTDSSGSTNVRCEQFNKAYDFSSVKALDPADGFLITEGVPYTTSAPADSFTTSDYYGDQRDCGYVASYDTNYYFRAGAPPAGEPRVQGVVRTFSNLMWADNKAWILRLQNTWEEPCSFQESYFRPLGIPVPACISSWGRGFFYYSSVSVANEGEFVAGDDRKQYSSNSWNLVNGLGWTSFERGPYQVKQEGGCSVSNNNPVSISAKELSTLKCSYGEPNTHTEYWEGSNKFVYGSGWDVPASAFNLAGMSKKDFDNKIIGSKPSTDMMTYLPLPYYKRDYCDVFLGEYLFQGASSNPEKSICRFVYGSYRPGAVSPTLCTKEGLKGPVMYLEYNLAKAGTSDEWTGGIYFNGVYNPFSDSSFSSKEKCDLAQAVDVGFGLDLKMLDAGSLDAPISALYGNPQLEYSAKNYISELRSSIDISSQYKDPNTKTVVFALEPNYALNKKISGASKKFVSGVSDSICNDWKMKVAIKKSELESAFAAGGPCSGLKITPEVISPTTKCKNGVVDIADGEQCDFEVTNGIVNLNKPVFISGFEKCENFNGYSLFNPEGKIYTGGVLKCNPADCRFDKSSCIESSATCKEGDIKLCSEFVPKDLKATRGVCAGSYATCTADGKWPAKCTEEDYKKIEDYYNTDMGGGIKEVKCDGKDNDCNGLIDDVGGDKARADELCSAKTGRYPDGSRPKCFGDLFQNERLDGCGCRVSGDCSDVFSACKPIGGGFDSGVKGVVDGDDLGICKKCELTNGDQCENDVMCATFGSNKICSHCQCVDKQCTVATQNKDCPAMTTLGLFKQECVNERCVDRTKCQVNPWGDICNNGPGVQLKDNKCTDPANPVCVGPPSSNGGCRCAKGVCDNSMFGQQLASDCKTGQTFQDYPTCKCVENEGYYKSPSVCGDGKVSGNEECDFVSDPVNPGKLLFAAPDFKKPLMTTDSNCGKSVTPFGDLSTKPACIPPVAYAFEGQGGLQATNNKNNECKCRAEFVMPIIIPSTSGCKKNYFEGPDGKILRACDNIVAPDLLPSIDVSASVVSNDVTSCCDPNSYAAKGKSISVGVQLYLPINGKMDKIRFIDTSKIDSTSFTGDLDKTKTGHTLTSHGDGTFGGIEDSHGLDPEGIFGTADKTSGRKGREDGSVDVYVKYLGAEGSEDCMTYVGVMIHGYAGLGGNRENRYCTATVPGHLRKGSFVLMDYTNCFDWDPNGKAPLQGKYMQEKQSYLGDNSRLVVDILDEPCGVCELTNLHWEIDGKSIGPVSSVIAGDSKKVTLVANAKNCAGKNIFPEIYESVSTGFLQSKNVRVGFDTFVKIDSKKFSAEWNPVYSSAGSKGNKYFFSLSNPDDNNLFSSIKSILLKVNGPSKERVGSTIKVVLPSQIDAASFIPGSQAMIQMPSFNIRLADNSEVTCPGMTIIQTPIVNERGEVTGVSNKVPPVVCPPKDSKSSSSGSSSSKKVYTISVDDFVTKFKTPLDPRLLSNKNIKIVVSLPDSTEKDKKAEFEIQLEGGKFVLSKDQGGCMLNGVCFYVLTPAEVTKEAPKKLPAVPATINEITKGDGEPTNNVADSCEILKLAKSVDFKLSAQWTLDKRIDETISLSLVKDKTASDSSFAGVIPVYSGEKIVSLPDVDEKGMAIKKGNVDWLVEVKLSHVANGNILEYTSGASVKPSSNIYVAIRKVEYKQVWFEKKAVPLYGWSYSAMTLPNGGYFKANVWQEMFKKISGDMGDMKFMIATDLCTSANCEKQTGKINYNHYPGMAVADVDRSRFTYDLMKVHLAAGSEGFTEYQSARGGHKLDASYYPDKVGLCDVDTGIGWSSGGKWVAESMVEAYNIMNKVYTKNTLNKYYTQSFILLDGTGSRNGEVDGFSLDKLPPTVPCFLNFRMDTGFGGVTNDKNRELLFQVQDVPYNIDVGGHWGVRSPVVTGAIAFFNDNLKNKNLVKVDVSTGKADCSGMKNAMKMYLSEVATLDRSHTREYLTDSDVAFINGVLNKLSKDLGTGKIYNIKRDTVVRL